MSNEKYRYEQGAIHQDHHKEININGNVTADSLKSLMAHFFEEEAEEAEFAEAEEECLSEQQPAASEPLNYFAPQKNLQVLLSKPWFKELRTKEVYDQAWTDAFVKGYILGLLADACVLRGSYNQIATKAGVTDDPRSFSRYMAEGKKQPYARWVKEYVIEH